MSYIALQLYSAVYSWQYEVYIAFSDHKAAEDVDINLPTMVAQGGAQLSPTEEGRGEGVRKGQPTETEEVEGERGLCVRACMCAYIWCGVPFMCVCKLAWIRRNIYTFDLRCAWKNKIECMYCYGHV